MVIGKDLKDLSVQYNKIVSTLFKVYKQKIKGYLNNYATKSIETRKDHIRTIGIQNRYKGVGCCFQDSRIV